MLVRPRHEQNASRHAHPNEGHATCRQRECADNMSLPKPRQKTRSTPGLVEPIEKKASRDQQKQHKEEADGKIQDQQEPVEQGRRPDAQSKLHSAGTQLLVDEEHGVLAQHQDKCKNCRVTNQEPRPDPRYFISWVLGISSIRTNLGSHGGVAGGRGYVV